jgi:protein-S-isoprenylcysteine O-methyltransferase Ste14
MAPLQVMYWLWDAFLVSWIVAAVWSARATVRAPIWSEAWRDALAVTGAVIVFVFAAPEIISGGGVLTRIRALSVAQLWQTPRPAAWGLVALTAAGLGFCWWARLHLGRLWSGVAGRKADHRIVDTGPYRLVRHPIYTGILAGLLAMGLLKGTVAALIGVGLAVAAFWLKARLEERFLRSELGAELYDAYSRRTPMLLPFVARMG